MKQAIERIYLKLIWAGDRLQSLFLLAVRLYWGWQFAQTGWGKLADLSKVTSFFAQLGIPAPGFNAVFISLLEFAGGILLAAGVASRLIALLLAGDMVVAFLTADREALFSIFSDPDKLYAAAPYTFLFASLLVLIFGPGGISIDALLGKKKA
ncbi:MAG TPA: DoxX family protein [Candidatus Acidoferrum sp.]|nr:DoxX family protein [Candidatus Acidoferrum sp.]